MVRTIPATVPGERWRDVWPSTATPVGKVGRPVAVLEANEREKPAKTDAIEATETEDMDALEREADIEAAEATLTLDSAA